MLGLAYAGGEGPALAEELQLQLHQSSLLISQTGVNWMDHWGIHPLLLSSPLQHKHWATSHLNVPVQFYNPRLLLL